MAKCAICEKGAHFGNNVSHSHRRSNKMWRSNIQHVKVKTECGAAKKMLELKRKTAEHRKCTYVQAA